MEVVQAFFLTFFIVFVGELGDKSQIAAGTSSLLYKGHRGTVFFSSALALCLVTTITTFAAAVIPASYVKYIITGGGILLVFYSLYLLLQIFQDFEEGDALDVERRVLSTKKVFWTQFLIVFTAEFGDKTQIATLAIAIENQDKLLLVFGGSLLALICITGLTVWGVSFLPQRWIRKVQILGALSLFAYGVYMLT